MELIIRYLHPLRVEGEGSSLKSQKKQAELHEKLEVVVNRLETTYGNMSKAHVSLQADFKAEKKKHKNKSNFMVKIQRGINAIFKWGQPNKKVPIEDEDDSEEYSFVLDDDDDHDAGDDGAQSSTHQ